MRSVHYKAPDRTRLDILRASRQNNNTPHNLQVLTSRSDWQPSASSCSKQPLVPVERQKSCSVVKPEPPGGTKIWRSYVRQMAPARPRRDGANGIRECPTDHFVFAEARSPYAPLYLVCRSCACCGHECSFQAFLASSTIWLAVPFGAANYTHVRGSCLHVGLQGSLFG